MTSFSDFVASRPAAEQAEADIRKYTEILVEALMLDFKRRGSTLDYSYKIEEARKYLKIWMITESGSRSIHAFVDKKTGSVLKPASTKAPAKGERFNLLDEASREDMLSRVNWAGGYLYRR